MTQRRSGKSLASPRDGSPARQLASFLAKYTPAVAKVARAAHRKMRQRLPGAIELVYDNYNALVIGFGPSERPSEAIFSLAMMPRYVVLCFLHGAKLKDPDKRLRGSGNQVRNVILRSAADIDKPTVSDFIAQALTLSPKTIDPTGKRRMIIKSIAVRQRPRRPG